VGGFCVGALYRVLELAAEAERATYLLVDEGPLRLRSLELAHPCPRGCQARTHADPHAVRALDEREQDAARE
jgi:hypothetical protein